MFRNGQSFMITHDLVRELLDYSPETGVMAWKVRANSSKGWNNRYAGKPVGNLQDGYLNTSIFKKKVHVHRLIWFWVHGEWPRIIDHIDRDRLNNKLSNLRNVDDGVNARNKSMRRNNKSGAVGVHWGIAAKKWVAQIVLNKKTHHLGVFETVEEASIAYQSARDRLHPGVVLVPIGPRPMI